MFRRTYARDAWGRPDANSRSGAAMAMDHPKPADPILQPDPAMLSRYQSSAYYAPQSQVSSLSGGGGSFSRQAWSFDVPALDLEYPTTPADTPYNHSLTSAASYYPDSAVSSVVGYPESSQRTLLDEAAYTGAYSLPYANGALSFRNDACAVSDQSLTHYPTSAGNRGRSTADDNGAAYGLGRAYTAARDNHPQHSHDSAISQSLPTYASSTASMSPSMMLPMLDMFSPSSASPLAPVITDSNTLRDAQASVRQAPYTLHQRRHSMDSNASALSASAVPSLVYDGELGDDYDADSDGSPTSAGSDLSRASYHTGASSAFRRDDWARPALEHAFSSPDVPQQLDCGAQAPRSESGYQSSSDDRLSPRLPSEAASDKPKSAQKKSKMHKCTICFKMFPRPSGLATHMNSHSGAKPFKCPIPTCTKSFAVRSNAKRHLRTHGIFPSADTTGSASAQFQVGFETPLVSEVHEVGKLPAKLRWVPQSLATRTNVDYLRDASDSDEEYPAQSCPMLPVPLPPVKPAWDDRLDERDGAYLPSQWRSLPGPAVVAAGGF